MKAFAGALFLMLVVPAGDAAARPPIVVEALKALSADDGTWSWVQTTVEHGRRTMVERFDPSRQGERWTLVENDGRAPTARELSAYRKRKASEDRRIEERKAETGRQKDDFDELIRKGSLKLLREDAELAVWSFLPPETGEMAELEDAIKGTLTIGKRRPHPFTIEMTNDSPMRLAPGIRIERMYVRLDFRPLPGGGPVVLHQSESVLRGRFLVKRLNEQTVTTYGDYRKIAAP
jgi:hypothetical protein